MKYAPPARWFTLLLSAPLAGFAAGSVELDTVNVTAARNGARYDYLNDTATGATKTATPAADTPQAVSVVTRRQLDEREPQDIAETLAYTSGASGGYRGENTHMEMSVRGIGGKSDGGALPTYWDGLAYHASLEINPYVIDRIEVLKGPSSVLYGQANPGGLVNLITKEATGSNENEIIFKTGSGNRAEVGLDIDRELNPATAWRIVADAKQADWQAGKASRQRGLTLAPSLTWTPDENTSLTLKGFYERQPEAGDRNFLTSTGTLYPVNGARIPLDFFSGDAAYHDLSNTKMQLGYKLHHRFNNTLSLSQNVRYGRYDNDLRSLIVWYAGAGSELVRKARIFDESYRDVQADTRLEWQPDSHHKVLFGADYLNRRYDLAAYLGDAPSIDWQNPVYGVNIAAPALSSDESTRVRQVGLYLQDQINYGRWHLLIGGRYDRARMDYHDDFRQSSFSNTEGRFSWRAGALYRFDNGIHPYISYSTSFLPESGTDADGNALKPTTAAQYEAGIKYQPNDKIMLTAAWFNIDQKHVTVYDPVTYNKSQFGNIRTRGAEIELQGDITPAWGISGSYTWLDKHVRRDANPALVGNTQWGVPEHSASLWSDYRFSGALQGLSVGAGVRYIGKTWGNNANTFRVPAYTVWDAKIAYKPGNAVPALKGTTVQLNLQNLANKQYVASCANDAACFYGKGRRITLSAGYRW